MKLSVFQQIYSQLTIDPSSVQLVITTHPDIPPDTIQAIHRRKFQNEIIRNIGRLQVSQTPEALQNQCIAAKSVKLVALQYNVSVCSLARLILKSMEPVDRIGELLRSPDRISDPDLREILAREIDAQSDFSHPHWDQVKRAHGMDMENLLKALLRLHNVHFFSEDHLRSMGFPKTPDAKLVYPIGLTSQPVCWIESKALFGDPNGHEEYMRTQYQPYANRFGPGAVVYWHGFVEDLSQTDGLLIFDEQTFTEALKTMIKIE